MAPAGSTRTTCDCGAGRSGGIGTPGNAAPCRQRKPSGDSRSGRLAVRDSFYRHSVAVPRAVAARIGKQVRFRGEAEVDRSESWLTHANLIVAPIGVSAAGMPSVVTRERAKLLSIVGIARDDATVRQKPAAMVAAISV